MVKEEVAAIVLSAGQGKRMGTKIPKQYLEINGKPVIYYSLMAFEKSFVDKIILVAGENDIEYCRREIVEKYNFSKVTAIVAGGKERYHSVYNGILAADGCDYVLIHDGARPFVDEATLLRNIETVRQTKACVTGMPVKDTIKEADENGFVQRTIPRETVWQIQTPQTFGYSLIRKSYESFIAEETQIAQQGITITDDAMVAEYFSHIPVKLVNGSYDNVKITTPEDIAFAEQYCRTNDL